MVLHQNKWDKKARRAHVRKLQSQGKDDDTQRGKRTEKTKLSAENRPNANTVSASTDSLTTEEDGAEVDPNAQSDEQAQSGQEEFGRRNVASNAWRYEEEDPEFSLANEIDVSEPESEPDYVQLTRTRKEQLTSREEERVRAGLVDEAFLRESLALTSRGHTQYDRTTTKCKLVKVDRRDFCDLTEKITKQTTADAFRTKYAAQKKNARTHAVAKDEQDIDVDDVDTFLEELSETEKKVSRENTVHGHEALPQVKERQTDRHINLDDDWLDQMLS